MSEASRAAALAHAATVHHGSADAVATLETAEAFHAFISGDSPEKPSRASVPTKPTKPAATKPKPTKPVEPEDDAAGEETAAEGETSKDDVGAAIEALLNANLRDKVIKLYAKFKAKSLSSVKPEDYAAIKQEAEDILLNS